MILYRKGDLKMINLIGQQFGNYRILQQIGQGGFANVFLGEHLYLKTRAAIKVIHTQMSQNDLQDFLNEAQMLAALKHPHIVRILDFGEQNDIPFLIMEYAAQGTLRQRHPRGPILPITTILPYVKQVAAALQYAHDHKLIHRDVKPANVLLDEQDNVLLSDFGIATIAHHTSSMQTSTFAGTAAYMAPEQLRGKPVPASDQYALAIMVYEWLCGQLPYEGDPVAVGIQHLTTPIPSLCMHNDALSPDIEAVVHQAMAKDPKRRFVNVQAFATALAQASEPTLLQILAPELPPSPTAATILPTQPPSPTTAPPLPSSALPSPPSGTSISAIKPQSAKRGIPRRTALLGLIGLTVTSIAASGLIWLTHPFSSSSYFTPSTSNMPSPRTSDPTSIPTPTPTPTPIGTTFYTYHGHFDQIRAIAWSPDSKRIVSASADTTAQVWDASTGGNALIYRGHSSYVEGVAWSPDSQRIASGSADSSVQIWNANTGNLIYTYPGHSLWVNRVSWSYDGKYIASGEQSSTAGKIVEVRVWAVDTGNTLVIYRGHANGVFAVAWSPDGTRIASDGYDGTVQVWEATTGKLISSYKDNIDHFGLSWSPDNKYIVVGGYDRRARVLDAKTGNIVYAYDSQTKAEGDVAWSPEGNHIALGCDDQTVQIWDRRTGSIVFTYQGHTDWLSALAWSPDSKRIASGSHDTTVRVWQAT